MNKKPISPVCWVPTVYFAMGLPFVALSMVSVLMFSDMEVSNAQIAFWTSLIMLPWTLKPLWSPFLEMFKTKKYFVVATEIITGLAFALVALSLPLPDFFRYAIALMGIIALSGATHDIAGDGVYLTELTATQQAKYIGWQGAFYNLAKILANGGLVWLAGMLKDEFGVVHAWMIVMLMCAGIMILIGLYHIRILPSGGGASGEVNTMSDALNMLWEVIRSFLPKKTYCFLHCLYHFVPVCRRICHQDCTVVPESVGCGWWIGTQHSGYRTGIWYVRSGSFYSRFAFGRLLHFGFRTSEDFVFFMLRF